ncbi:hypothetical protein [Mesorhizobium sp. M0715]|uniref:hypothetical protein n=1 Tax=Mesorhizobium sp. M0715 TaxID=2956990 RepID=UPI0033361FD0
MAPLCVAWWGMVGLSARRQQPPLVNFMLLVRLYGNLFQPSFKLQEEMRIGARVIKCYHPPVPPAARVLTHPGVAQTDKQQLQETADPVLLFAGIRAAQEELGRRVDRSGLNAKED